MRVAAQADANADAPRLPAGAGHLPDRVLLARVLRYAWRNRASLAVALALLPLISLFELAQPYLIQRAIDDHIAAGRLAGLDGLGLLYLGALAGQYLTLFLQTYLMQRAGQQAMRDLRADVYRHVLGLSQAFFDRTPVGRLMTRMTQDIESLAELFAAGLVSLIADGVKLALIVITIFWLDARLALFALGAAPVLWLLAWLFRRIVRESFREVRSRMARLNTFLQEHLSGLRVVQAFAQEARTLRRFDEHNRGYRQASARAIGADAALYSIVEAVGAIATAGLLWHGGGRILAGTLTFGVLVAFIEYLQKFFAPLRDLSTKFTVVQQAMASAERLFELLDTDVPDAPVSAAAAPEAAAAGPPGDLRVRFEGVTFAYRPGQPVLRDVDLSLPRGQTLAVVGASGAGKSTLVKLLLRFCDPDAGRILLDGIDVRTLSGAEVRARVALVAQDPFLFSGSLAEAIGGQHAQDDPERLARALARAGASDLVARRPGGLQTSVSERGGNFSAGERQLLALARALAREPDLLVLDEATASVDPETERRIEQGIAELLRGRTCLVIAHRFSTIARADRVLVLDRGRVVEEGTQAELIARDGLFARLHRLQQHGGLQERVRAPQSAR